MKSIKQQKHLERLAEIKRGKVSPIKGISRPPFSQEWKNKISNSRKGFKVSEETKKKISIGHTGKILSRVTRERMSKSARRGIFHYMWKGGTSSLHQQIRQCYSYRQWRSDCFTRDNFTCQICGIHGGYLEADHIKPLFLIIKENNILSIEDAFRCSEMWNINNSRTLCKICHRKTDTFGVKVLKKYV